MTKRIITINEARQLANTLTIKDNSPRGCKTISSDDVKINDKVLIDNYFHLVIE